MTYFVLKDPRLARPALALEVSRGPYQRSAHLYAPAAASIKDLAVAVLPSHNAYRLGI